MVDFTNLIPQEEMLQLEQQSVADADAAQRPELEIGICHSGPLNFTESVFQKVKSLTVGW